VAKIDIIKFMYTTKDEAPAEFMRHYERIMKGEDKLDTIARLKEFWLFAIEQGKPHREMREHIASLVETASWKADVILAGRSILGMNTKDTTGVMSAFDMWQAFKAVDRSPFPGQQTDEEYNNEQWQMLAEEVNRITV
jgi:hypothetical protein